MKVRGEREWVHDVAPCFNFEQMGVVIQERRCVYEIIIVEGSHLAHSDLIRKHLSTVFLLDLSKEDARYRRTQEKHDTMNPQPLSPEQFDDAVWPEYEEHLREKLSLIGSHVIRKPSPKDTWERDKQVKEILNTLGYSEHLKGLRTPRDLGTRSV